MTKNLKTFVLAAAAALGSAGASAQTTLNGAGATFPYPIYSKWFDMYGKAYPGVRINYQSIGSGGGIRQFTKKTVDFGASDGPMTAKQLYEVDGKSIHVPTVLGAVAVAVNVKGTDGKDIRALNLDGAALTDIFLGKIHAWDDERLKELNPGTALPGSPVTVIHRSDGSGTTYCFVDYLSAVSPEWKKKVGVATSVDWPVGLGGKGNEGVAGLLVQTPSSIGYVELIYAKQNNLAVAAMKNKAGKFVVPSVEGVTAAAAGAKVPEDFRVSIVDAPGAESYPISTFTWLLVNEKNPAGKGAVIKDFLKWMLADGQKAAADLGYAPLPENVKKMVAAAVERVR
ncbi:MAG: phosphate ABC transporter substrate-binding protein PstS [Elusimicrobia bacterium]|nr:phosphate ABC transporter substrate-binding protein PstS [Elusimicrobiota bacterium]